MSFMQQSGCLADESAMPPHVSQGTVSRLLAKPAANSAVDTRLSGVDAQAREMLMGT
jgi:hypothetical protein